MYLNKIELQGFKSFASKTTVELVPGITAIVGPNGSGKSNIADAVRWVMGEQSMKTLRSKKAEDIIFAGTREKSRAGMAEISLYLDNEDKKIPIEYSQVVLTRRIYRSGDSEYLINKSKARLLDVQSLLARSGFGQKTYSVIGQGMIDRILQSSPKEKKELFEEAVGIKQYQIKKQISVNKLNLTKQNLVRISGLLEEILPRLRSLKRQANKVHRKKELERELEKIGANYLNYYWNLDKGKKEANIFEMEELKEEERVLQDKILEVKKNLEAIEEKKNTLEMKEEEEALSNLRNKKNKLEQEIVLIDGRVQIEKEKSAPEDLSGEYQQAEKLKSKIENNKAEMKEMEKKLKETKRLTDQKYEERKQALDKIREKQSNLLDLQRELAKPTITFHEIISELENIYESQNALLDKFEKIENLEEIKSLQAEGRQHREKIEYLLGKIKEEVKREKSEDQQSVKDVQLELNLLFRDKDTCEESISVLRVTSATVTTKKEIKGKEISDDERELKFLNEKIKFNESKDKEPGENPVFAKLENEKNVFISEEKIISQKIEVLGKKFSTIFSRQAEEKKKIFDLEKEYRQIQEELNALRDSIRSIEIEKVKIEDKRGETEEEIREIFKSNDFAEITAEFKKNPYRGEKEDLGKLRFEIDKMKRQLIQIGEPDLEVLKEYEECNKRYDFLFTQKNDLEGAIASLEKIVDELNSIMNEKFEKSFKGIDEQFQKYFKILFGGGKAKLYKRKYVEEGIDFAEGAGMPKEKKDNYVETSIEIKANPPGKKLTDLNLLSGGEKALTAIALILAIISNNPAPFIILDEVDAALDEANSNKYAEILRSVAKKTQFIAITHNRETMKMADAIYGVTMDKTGITKLLSVKLDKISA